MQESVFTDVHYSAVCVSLVARTGKTSPIMQETWVRPQSWEDLLEEGMATHSNILAWRITMEREAWWATAHETTMLEHPLPGS